MSETGQEKPIKIYYNDWGKVYEYETHYISFCKGRVVDHYTKPIIDTRPPYIENPDGTVMREAAFYALMGSPRTEHVKFTELDPFFPSSKVDANYRNWFSGGAWLCPQTLPADIGWRWSHFVLTAPPLAFAPYTPPPQVTDPAMLALIPDVFTLSSLPLVSDGARAVLEAQFPDGSYFLPTTITAANGARTERDYFHWVQRHRLFFDKGEVAGKPEPKRALVWNFHHPSGDIVQWEMIHNAALRAFLQGLPYWGSQFDLTSPIFTSRCFHALKAARLTGLIENTATDPVQHSEQPPYNPWELIGHID